MACSFLYPNDKFAVGLHKDKCKDSKSILEYKTAKDDLPRFRCVYCNKKYETYLRDQKA